MFCPKCGGDNPEDGKYCRKCGTNLTPVSQALTTGERGVPAYLGKDDPDDLFANAIKQLISGVGFLIVAAGLFITGVAGGRVWWWAMLFPAFGLLSKGISGYLKAKRIEKRIASGRAAPEPQIEMAQSREELPPMRQTGARESFEYDTGDLVPPSVTEDTTRHLKADSEGETMTLPRDDSD